MQKQSAGQSSLGLSTPTKSSPVCSFTLNKEGIVTGATTWMLKILGYMQEEFIGHHLGEFFADGGEGRLWTTRLVGRSPAHHRAVLVGKDRISRPVLLYASREYILGWLPRATSLVEIINALNRAEVKRQALASQFQAVLGSMEGGAYGIDMDGRCLFINEPGILYSSSAVRPHRTSYSGLTYNIRSLLGSKIQNTSRLNWARWRNVSTFSRRV